MDNILNLQGVTYFYGKTRGVEDIDLTINKGEVCSLAGANGSGKTTLIHLLIRWFHPQKGEIFLKGVPSRSWATNLYAREIAYVPQKEQALFDFTALSYAVTGRAPHLNYLSRPSKEDYRKTAECFSLLDAEHILHKPVTSLSEGEFRMVLIIRALVQEGDIIIMDEPDAGLDLKRKVLLRDAILQLKKQGKTVIFSTHDPQWAYKMSDCTVLMKEGRILARGPSSEVLTCKNISLCYGVDVEVVKTPGGVIFDY